MKRLWWWTVGGVVVAGLLIIAVLLVGPKNPIPGPIRSQLTSTLFLPAGQGITVDRSSAKYDAASKLLTFNASYAGTKLVMSEQPTPDQFVDIPEVYTKMVEGLVNYDSFDTSVGTVHLTTPKELGGKQAAVLNAKGTLLFAKPDKSLSADEWRIFFRDFQAR